MVCSSQLGTLPIRAFFPTAWESRSPTVAMSILQRNNVAAGTSAGEIAIRWQPRSERQNTPYFPHPDWDRYPGNMLTFDPRGRDFSSARVSDVSLGIESDYNCSHVMLVSLRTGD